MMELDQRLFNNYIEHKSEVLVDAIEQGMKSGSFDWDVCKEEPTEVRSYIQEIILTLVTIHCEVSSDAEGAVLTIVYKVEPLMKDTRNIGQTSL